MDSYRKSANYVINRIKIRNENRSSYAKITKMYRYRCALCYWSIPIKTPKKAMRQGGCELHHIIPISEGGSNEMENLILLCPNCHKEADVGLISEEILRKAQTFKLIPYIEYIKHEYKKAKIPNREL